MVLVLVLSVLTISYASSLKAYFQQHQQIAQLQHQIAASEASITQLEQEKARWNDPAYVKEQARARFGYLMPGETSYVVIGADGKPLAAQATLSDPRTSTTRRRPPPGGPPSGSRCSWPATRRRRRPSSSR